MELLVAAAVLMLLLGVLGALLLSTRRAYQTNQATSASAGQVRSAIEFIEYDVSLAGYGIQSGSAITAESCAGSSCNPEGVTGNVLANLSVNYVEDRFTATGETEMSVVYVVQDGHLVRCLNPVTECSLDSGSAIAAGVVALEVSNWRTSSGGTAEALPSDVSGVDLELHYRQADGIRSERFSVALLNPQGVAR